MSDDQTACLICGTDDLMVYLARVKNPYFTVKLRASVAVITFATKDDEQEFLDVILQRDKHELSWIEAMEREDNGNLS